MFVAVMEVIVGCYVLNVDDNNSSSSDNNNNNNNNNNRPIANW